MPATTGMKGAGFYDRHSGAQLAAIRALDDWVDDAVANLPLPAATRPVSVLDLGSSEGGNAIRLMAAIVAGLRRRTDQPLQTIYSDLASNDFNRLFGNLEEARRAGLVAPRLPRCGGRLRRCLHRLLARPLRAGSTGVPQWTGRRSRGR